MCCCETPNVNGQLGYRWQPSDSPRIRPVNAPTLGEHDTLLFDEPGRCGGLDAHSHHFRLVRHYGTLALLVRHGGGDERIDLARWPTLLETLTALDTTARYWLLHTIYSAHRAGASEATQREAARWRNAAAEKRIKVRKIRGTNGVSVAIAPKEG